MAEEGEIFEIRNQRFLSCFLFISVSDRAIYFLSHHRNMSLFTKYQLQLRLSMRFSTASGLFALQVTKITTKEIEIYLLQPPDVTF